jgi:hypothetical protein
MRRELPREPSWRALNKLGAFLTAVRANIFGPRADGSILREAAPRPSKLYLQQRGDAARPAELDEEGA